MTTIRTLVLAAALLAAPVFFLPLPGCKAPPNERVVAVQTLKSVGQAAEASVALSAQLYHDGRISAVQARQVMEFYDVKFTPSFRLAVIAANSNLDNIASPDVMNLATQLATLVANLQPRTTK